MLLGLLEALGSGPPLGLPLPLDGLDRGVGPGPAFFGIAFIPTVSIGVTCAVVYTYGRDDGRTAPTRCAVCDKKSLE